VARSAKCLSFVVSTSLAGALACGQVGAGTSGTVVDAGRDRSVRGVDAGEDRGARVADAGLDHFVHDAADEHDAGSVERHFIDADVQCEGGTPWGPCGLTDAAELACDASTDCTWQSNGSCCSTPTFGVNKNAPPLGCPGPPCLPPKTSQPECQTFSTQDCHSVDAAVNIIVECVDHRCMTRAGSS
jgi:hypothetical protein